MRILRDQLKKDKEAEERELRSKKIMRDRDIQVKRTLDMQMDQKAKNKQDERRENAKFVKMLIDQDENDKKVD